MEESKTANTPGSKVAADNFDMTGIDMETTPSVTQSIDFTKQPTKLKTEIKGSILSKYFDVDGESTVYYMKPRSNDIFLLNPSTNEFVGESLKWMTKTEAHHPN